MLNSTDQLGNRFEFKNFPLRIISLVPSQSEYLWALGLKERLLGITKFCVHPDDMYNKVKRVGGTKNVDLLKIESLQPDLIIGNKEENDRSQIEILSKHYPVWMSDIKNFEDAFNMMKELGRLLGKETEANDLILRAEESVSKSQNLFSKNRTAYFIWNNPYRLAASGTFIHHVLQHAGFMNAAANLERYPEVNADELRSLDPEICLLSSEPYPFKEAHAKTIKEILPTSKIHFVDGEMFSWYGSRLIYLYEYLLRLKEKIYA